MAGSTRAGGGARSGRGLSLLVVAVLVVAAGFGVRALWAKVADRVDTGCSFGSYRTSTDQASTAAEMVSVVTTRKLPERAAVLVLAAGLQESKLTNIPSGQGDRDSVGVLQQRPSQGWGKKEQLADVTFATGAFLDALVKVPNWKTGQLADVIQQVQISADGTAYAKHEPQAQAMADALTGTVARGISCSFPSPTEVASAQDVTRLLASQLPVSTPTVAGRRITVPGAGAITAAWLVANADRMGIDAVSYAGGTWSRTSGWKAAQATATEVVATLH